MANKIDVVINDKERGYLKTRFKRWRTPEEPDVWLPVGFPLVVHVKMTKQSNIIKFGRVCENIRESINELDFAQINGVAFRCSYYNSKLEWAIKEYA